MCLLSSFWYDYGEGVKSIQTILSKLGLYSGPIHSFMDEETVAALKEFQRVNGLVETGKSDRDTLSMFSKYLYDDKRAFEERQLEDVLALFD